MKLNDCDISKTAVSELCFLISKNFTLQRLDLDNCELSERYLKDLVSALKENKSLRLLNMNNTNLTQVTNLSLKLFSKLVKLSNLN